MTNPLLAPPSTPFGTPPFAEIEARHFAPAYEAAMAEHDREIAAIAANPAPATFDNTVGALERAGAALQRTGAAFWTLATTAATPELMALERTLAPKLAAHFSAIGLNEGVFRRVRSAWEARDTLNLTPEQARLLALTFDSFKRSGALLSADEKARYSAIAMRLSTLYTQFSQNVLKDETDWAMFLTAGDLEGTPASLRAAAAQAAADRGRPGAYAITLARSSVEPFLATSTRRDLRERAFAAWTRRGELSPETDNRAIMAEIVRLRDETARLLGYETYAAFKLEDQMAKTPDHVRTLLERVWGPALAKAADERAVLQAIATREGEPAPIAAHDWRFYAEKARREIHAIDDYEVSAYLSLDNVMAAAFDVARRLFGLTFREVKGLALHHPDARAFEALDETGAHVALFIADYFARPGKRGGAWMSSLRPQSNMDAGSDATPDTIAGASSDRRNAARVRPIIINVMNFAKGPDAGATALSLTDAKTLFHEFGHALHGMLSDVTYPSIAGTNVARDFVEFPSQLYEHWLTTREVLSTFARHAKTGAPMSDDLIARLQGARQFNQGFATVEYLSSALVDLALHTTHPDDAFDVTAFERGELARLGMPNEIVMRHRTPHFGHVFNGAGYAAGYYAYLWSETLDADGFKAFEETGDAFDPATARRLKDFVYSAGGRTAPEEAYRQFRGSDPDPQALMEQRGLAEARA